MSGIKVREIAYIRLRSPDLDRQQEFLTHFGLQLVERSDDILYMRGSDPERYIHVTEKGDPKVVGLAWYAACEDDLYRLAEDQDASDVEPIEAPGGGKRVCLTDPNGFQVEVVHGIEPGEPIQVEQRLLNTGNTPFARAGTLMRIKPAPSAVKRIGHCAMFTPKFADTLTWYREKLGFIGSDDLYAGDPSNVVGSFNRCDAGDDYVDHHTFFTMKTANAGLNHVSFEVNDMDEVFLGHQHLEQTGKYTHVWGIGRHLMGSMVFDYWEDPWGRVHEHWADSDRLNAANGSNLIPVAEGMRSQWGDEPPERFRGYVCR